jgi:P27 family predicted phage terminase small subunit
MRGRKPMPTALKLIKGMRRGVNLDEPKVPPGRPECPGHLSAAARKEFARLVELLEPARILTPLDGEALALYCSHFDRWQLAERKIHRFGILLETPHGKKSNPMVRVADAAMVQMLKLLGEFGLTPASRSKLHAIPPTTAPLEGFLKAKPPAGS